MNFAKEMLKNIRCSYTLYKKNSLFCNQAFNSGNDQIIRKNITAILPVTFKENSFVVAKGLVAFRCYIGVFLYYIATSDNGNLSEQPIKIDS